MVRFGTYGYEILGKNPGGTGGFGDKFFPLLVSGGGMPDCLTWLIGGGTLGCSRWMNQQHAVVVHREVLDRLSLFFIYALVQHVIKRLNFK